MDPDLDPGGPKTYGSGSATLVFSMNGTIRLFFVVFVRLNLKKKT
jgi:hypothetical protein